MSNLPSATLRLYYMRGKSPCWCDVPRRDADATIKTMRRHGARFLTYQQFLTAWSIYQPAADLPAAGNEPEDD